MPGPIRSADFLVLSALANPETLQALRTRPEETLKRLAEEATARTVPPPSQPTSNALWLIIVGAVTLVVLWSAFLLGRGVTTKLDTGATYVAEGATILTMFTTGLAFLAGLLAPSPLKSSETS